MSKIENNYEDVLKYSFKIDFSDLAIALRETRKINKENSSNISSFSTVINALREEKNASQNQLNEHGQKIEQLSLSTDKHLGKLMELEAIITKGLSSANENINTNQVDIITLIDKKITDIMNYVDKKLNAVINETEKNKAILEKIELKHNEHNERLDNIETALSEEIVNLKYENSL